MTGKKNPITIIFFLSWHRRSNHLLLLYQKREERTKFLSYFDVSGIKCLICKYKVATYFRKPILVHISKSRRSGAYFPNFVKYLDLQWKEFQLDGLPPTDFLFTILFSIFAVGCVLCSYWSLDEKHHQQMIEQSQFARNSRILNDNRKTTRE